MRRGRIKATRDGKPGRVHAAVCRGTAASETPGVGKACEVVRALKGACPLRAAGCCSAALTGKTWTGMRSTRCLAGRRHGWEQGRGGTAGLMC